MKVKELIEKLSKLDQDRDIWIGYDYPHQVDKPDFVEMDECRINHLGEETRLKIGDYIHFAE